MAIVFLVDSSLMMFCQTLKKDIKYPMQGMVYQTAVIFMIALGICWWTQQTLTECRARGNRIRIPHLMVGWVKSEDPRPHEEQEDIYADMPELLPAGYGDLQQYYMNDTLPAYPQRTNIKHVLWDNGMSFNVEALSGGNSVRSGVDHSP
ncbi:hypothetical protein C8J57DRAFT_1226276 [Mycena rebaudengoi]|nr:hypothetical protein C8J57DRAFT_1226276 [Mycena rebaudengoi]